MLYDISGKLIYVHEFEIEDKFLMNPEEVQLKGNVLDTILNEEYWYIGEDNLTPNKVYLIVLKDYYKEEHSSLSLKLQEIYAEEKGDIDIDDYYDLENGIYYATVFKPTDVLYEIRNSN